MSLAQQLKCENIIDGLFMHGGSAVKLSADSSTQTDEFFLRLCESIDADGEPDRIKFFINIFSIIDTAVKNRNMSVPCIKNKISDVIAYINRNLHQKLTLGKISYNTQISKYYLCHSFGAATGMTVFEYVQFARLAKAKQLLAQTDDSILDIGLAVGFDSPAYFAKVFRESENMTPVQFRTTSNKCKK